MQVRTDSAKFKFWAGHNFIDAIALKAKTFADQRVLAVWGSMPMQSNSLARVARQSNSFFTRLQAGHLICRMVFGFYFNLRWRSADHLRFYCCILIVIAAAAPWKRLRKITADSAFGESRNCLRLSAFSSFKKILNSTFSQNSNRSLLQGLYLQKAASFECITICKFCKRFNLNEY